MRALIAGTGRLPELVAESMETPPLVCREFGLDADVNFRMEQIIPFLSGLRDRGITEVCFAGAMSRPPIDPKQIDPATALRAEEIMRAMAQGDDATLSFFADLFAEYGMELKGAHLFAPDLLAPAGVIAGDPLSKAEEDDTARGREILDHLGPIDVTQSCVVAHGQVLGIEPIQGTEAMLRFVAATREKYAGSNGGVLVKRAKPGQDLRFDMPAIGPDTVEQAASAGLRAIVIGAETTLLIDRAEIEIAANRHGISILGEA